MRRVHKELHRTSTVHVSLYACITQHTRPAQPRIEATVSMCDTYLCLLYTKASKNRDVQSYHASISTVQSKKNPKITQWTRIHIYFRLTFFWAVPLCTHFFYVLIIFFWIRILYIFGDHLEKLIKSLNKILKPIKNKWFFWRGWYLCVVEYTDFTQYNNKVV